MSSKMAQTILTLAMFIVSFQMVFSIIPPEIMKACREESGFAGNMTTINFDEPSTVPNEAKCYLACTLGSQKVINDDGTFDKEAAHELIKKISKGDEEKKQKLAKDVDECISEVPVTPDKCVNAFEYVKCKKGKMNPKKE